jgi:hypothetical protein
MSIDIIRRLILAGGDGIEVYKLENGNMGVTYVKADGGKFIAFELQAHEVSELLRMFRGMSRSMKLLGRKRGPRAAKTGYNPPPAPPMKILG